MTSTWQKVLGITIGTLLVVWIGDIALGSYQFDVKFQEALSDPYGCSFSPDNFGCELNRPFDKEKEEDEESPVVSDD